MTHRSIANISALAALACAAGFAGPSGFYLPRVRRGRRVYGGLNTPERPLPQPPGVRGKKRNEPCPCGCGKKRKNCNRQPEKHTHEPVENGPADDGDNQTGQGQAGQPGSHEAQVSPAGRDGA